MPPNSVFCDSPCDTLPAALGSFPIADQADSEAVYHSIKHPEVDWRLFSYDRTNLDAFVDCWFGFCGASAKRCGQESIAHRAAATPTAFTVLKPERFRAVTCKDLLRRNKVTRPQRNRT